MINQQLTRNKMLAIIKKQKTYIDLTTNKSVMSLVTKRFITENVIIFLLQYTGLNLTTLSTSHCPLWLASGTACGYLFLRGLSVLPGIWLGSFIAYLLAGINIITSTYSASLYTLQAYLLLLICYQLNIVTLLFYSIKEFIKFLITCITLTAVFSYMLILPFHPKLVTWLWAWLANLNGCLILGFALVTWDAYFPQIKELKSISKYKLLLLSVFIIFLIIMILINTQHLSYIMLPCLILTTAYVSKNYGWCGTNIIIFISGFSISITTYLAPPYFLPLLISLSIQIMSLLSFIVGFVISIWDFLRWEK